MKKKELLSQNTYLKKTIAELKHNPIFPTLSLVCMILVNYFDTDNDNCFNGSRW